VSRRAKSAETTTVSICGHLRSLPRARIILHEHREAVVSFPAIRTREFAKLLIDHIGSFIGSDMNKIDRDRARVARSKSCSVGLNPLEIQDQHAHRSLRNAIEGERR